MENDLYKYIATLEDEMYNEQRAFFECWNNQIIAHLRVPSKFHIEDYVDLFGGYWVDAAEYERMDLQLKQFYNPIAIYKEKIYLRGYDYYKVDPLFHLQEKASDHNYLWGSFREKWNRYRNVLKFDYIKDNMSIENWIGTLGLLEYIFSDLTSIRWFLFRNKQHEIGYINEQYQLLTDVIDNATDLMAQIIAAMLLFDFNLAFKLISTHYHHIVNSCAIHELLDKRFEIVERASLRSMREGDSIALIYASYVLKLKPFCVNRQGKNILLMSNAFGAMNIGVIFKYLLRNVCTVSHANLLFAQHRSEGDFVYADLLTNQCYFFNEEERKKPESSDITIIVDDSVCFGKSYYNIKESLCCHNIYLLPLTLNCNGMKYFRIGINESDDINSIIRQSSEWAREINDSLPAFFSFWDFRRQVPQICTIKDETQRFALYGSDMLLNHLWTQYLDEIINEG